MIGGDPKQVCNWMNGEFAKLLNEDKIAASESKVSPAHLVDLVKLVGMGGISGKTAKDVFALSYKTGEMPSEIVSREGLSQISDSDSILAVIKDTISENPDAVAKFKDGKVNVKGFLVGKVLQRTKGRANAELVNSLMEAELNK
jgi:aspartyl-tRNA(Asn)/glutamyl-tRNA(Gln) amidotransferase subunit B